MSDSLALFARDDARFVATELAQGPWDPRHCHGGPPCALVTALADTTPSLVPMQIASVTIDLQRPVVVGAPLEATVTVARDGKRIQIVDVTLNDGDTTVVRCRALRIRRTQMTLPDERHRPAPAPTPLPDDLPRYALDPDRQHTGFWKCTELRFVQGELGTPLPGIAWFRIDAELADGLPFTPVARLAAIADYGSGVGAPLRMREHYFINPDLNLAIHREPKGDWIALDAAGIAEETGIGLATTRLFDVDGEIGVVTQTMLIEEC